MDGSFGFAVTSTFITFACALIVSGAKLLRLHASILPVLSSHDYQSATQFVDFIYGLVVNGIVCFHHNPLMDLCVTVFFFWFFHLSFGVEGNSSNI